MRPGMRFGLSAIEKGEVWSRWKAGESLHESGRAFDKPHSCFRAVLLPRGGIPAQASRSYGRRVNYHGQDRFAGSVPLGGSKDDRGERPEIRDL